MNALVKESNSSLTFTWQEWITENLNNGCSESAIIRDMVKANFDFAFAKGAVSNIRRKLDEFVGSDAPYLYETPRLPRTGGTIETADRSVRVSMRIAQPVIALLDNLLAAEECDELIRLSHVKLKRSTIVDPATGLHQTIDDRTSFGTFFNLNETEFIEKLDKRIAKVMNWPVENGEGLQILNYKVGGEYKEHFDYFPPAEIGSVSHLAKGGQRISTLVIYLNDVEQGGETIFPHVHLSVVPKKGSAIYFEYCNSLGQVDQKSLHGGKPVMLGEKWIATKWMRQAKYM